MTARVVVVGGGFGRIHAQAVTANPDRFELAGVAGQGGVASRELALAHGVRYFDLSKDLDDVASAADIACVAVGSAISGGSGTELAQQLLALGMHVLQEHPLHPDEILACARTARKHGVQHRVNLHYRQVRPVQAFIEAAQRLTAQSQPLFVDAAAPVHVLHPLIDVLAAALGGVRPWRWDEVTGEGPLHSITGTIAGVPITLRVQNQLDPLDRDNHALLWHRIALGTSAGVLTLADTHGPVLWSPRWHADRDQHDRLVLQGRGAEGLEQPSTTVLPGTEPMSMTGAMAQWWPEAVASALDAVVQAVATGADPLKQAQLDLSTARIWNDLTGRLGPAERITASAPSVISVRELTGQNAGQSADRTSDRSVDGTTDRAIDRATHRAADRAGDRGADRAKGEAADEWPPSATPGPYSLEAEFYDLIAAQRTNAVEEVVKALAGCRAGDGPVVEIGAGTGLLTVAVAKALPELKIVAAEPDPIMRAVLTSKVVRDPELRDRVTVTDGAAPDLQLPERIGAALVCGVAGHLTPEARRVLWQRLSERLTPGAPLIVELLALTPDARFGPLQLGQARIGEDDIQWRLSVLPHPEGSQMTSTWDVSRAGKVHRSAVAQHLWRSVTLQDVASESGLGLEVRIAGGADGAVPLGVLRLKN
ncbi:Gfo/Idh/MocA family oxidoreductase [Kineosporia sp. NBRC 101731]|uniref:Gfo/Idh/MocA family oxidoreductase n=1 Tax=Kineosporia sp. NBRC 101731 TaxID=3032199 RepID=UPI0024A3BEAC|nr:Gfo/Idh/MocA family oxidoreductase [Kineosporia sp. NBRC 101731]GLY32368.1 thiazolinyl imide reductase [Kineosporia sp. NBRC 101731]